MMANVLLETTLGAVPLVGDIFHVMREANRRNESAKRIGETNRLRLREKEHPGRHTGRDWMFLANISVIAITAVGVPIGILICIEAHPFIGN